MSRRQPAAQGAAQQPMRQNRREKSVITSADLFPDQKLSPEEYSSLQEAAKNHLVQRFGIDPTEAEKFAKQYIEKVVQSNSAIASIRDVVEQFMQGKE